MMSPGLRLANICSGLIERLSLKKYPQEEQVNIFLEGLLDYWDVNKENLPVSYYDFTGQIEKKWNYRHFEESMASEDIFLCGSILGASRLMQLKTKRSEHQKEYALLSEKYKSGYNVFTLLQTNPGIMHKELAGRIDKTPSGLTQFLAPMTRDGLLTFQRIGREKHYYLLPKGETVFTLIKEKSTKNAEKNWNFNYKRPVTSNHISIKIQITIEIEQRPITAYNESLHNIISTYRPPELSQLSFSNINAGGLHKWSNTRTVQSNNI